MTAIARDSWLLAISLVGFAAVLVAPWSVLFAR